MNNTNVCHKFFFRTNKDNKRPFIVNIQSMKNVCKIHFTKTKQLFTYFQTIFLVY